MINIFSSNYLSRKPIDLAMKNFAKKFDKDKKILDIGCGNKPYKKYFNCKYIGLDPIKETDADIIANSWSIPAANNEYDGIILNQSLEHIERINETIVEIKRILKPGGYCIITVPQTMKNHSNPIPSRNIELNNFDKNKIKYWHIDYYRFTKFGLIYLFRDFQIIEIKETNGYLSTIFQLINYFFSSFGMNLIFSPIFFINNIAGILLDTFFNALGLIRIEIFQKFKHLIYTSLTLNYILILKNNDKK
jgi:SAM-dependent methyltransferase